MRYVLLVCNDESEQLTRERERTAMPPTRRAKRRWNRVACW